MSGSTWLKYHKIQRFDARRRRNRELENREAAARREHAPHLVTRRGGVLDVADAEPDRDGVDGAIRERNARRVAAHQRDPVGQPPLPDFVLSDAQHRLREIDADDARGRRLRLERAAIARSAVPVHRSSTRSRPVSDSARIARFRQRRSMPALSRWLRRS